jgi:hypothetical protein
MPDAAAAPLADLLAAARAWAADDPDAVTRAELEGLAAAAEAGDEAAATRLADAMSGMLEFGTAGLRGHLGGGPNRMNRAVVIRAAAGLTAYLKTLDPEPFVVVGYDARTNSDVFAHDTCAVVVGMGGQASVLPHPLPTPVLISDHINLTATSPIEGANFVDLTDVYSPRLRAIAKEIDPRLDEGVYVQFRGPHYETPAEVRMAGIFGGDLVGMSTSLEAIAARQSGLEVLGISLVTNPAAGISKTPLNHEEVLEAGRDAADRCGRLLAAVVGRI